MKNDQYTRVKEIFLAACRLPAAERATYVAQACDDDGLRGEVEALLRGHLDATEPALPETAPVTDTPSEARATEPSSFEAGEFVAGRYRIVALLGRGGMGEVYRADDTALGQRVALKFLAPNVARRADWLKRLLEEARTAREISHPNICRVYDIGETEGRWFISMEYVDGEDLATLIRRIGRLPREKALDIAQQLCVGLAAAHGRGVLHRDLKPANVMLDGQGRVRLMDFGLARREEEIVGEEARAGTPAYMAPEQLAGETLSVRSDVYSLGLVLYELFTGKPAFRATRLAELLRERRDSRPTPPSSIIQDVDSAVERVIMHCLERDPAQRPAGALEVAAALPGGDVLAVALAAGQTPSPSIVAAAGETRGVSSRVAWTMLAAYVALLAASLVLPHTKLSPNWSSFVKPPAVLADRAETLFEALGYNDEDLDASQGFTVSRTFSATATRDDGTPACVTLATRDGADVTYWRRLGPPPLQAQRAPATLYRSGRVTLADPPLGARMATLILDPAGRLLAFEAGPARVAGDKSLEQEWRALFEAAELDYDDFTSASPALTPTMYATQRVAWRGGDVGRPLVRVEAAARDNAPVLFLVTEEAPVEADAAAGVRQTRVVWLRRVLLLSLVAISIPLTWSNLRRGQGDLRGALRLSVFIFLTRVIVWTLKAQHTAVWEAELTLLVYAAVGALSEAALVGMFYVALEPLARRHWPQAMIAWSRLLAGRARDPLVGRAALTGALLGVGWVLLQRLDALLTQSLGWPVREAWRDFEPLEALLGPRDAMAVTIELLRFAVYQGLFILLTMALLRAVLRNARATAIAGVVLIALISVPRGSHPVVSLLLIGVIGGGVTIWVLTRFGIVAIATAVFVALSLNVLPASLDVKSWYADLSLYTLATTTAAALFGFLTCRQGRPRAAVASRP